MREELLEAASAPPFIRADLPQLGDRIEGKVRDMYLLPGERRLLIATDRVSAFDRVFGAVPYRGQVLNQLSAFWFETTADIVANHMIATPDPNAMLTREATPLPVEVVVRGYITGSTSTSLWTLYNDGVERPYDLDLPVGLRKNARLPHAVITPTTKAERGAHDERLSPTEVVERGLVEPELWARVQSVALALFERGQAVARRAGLILVDTKYELGLIDGELALIDEVHTPDSSRYWVADSYETRFEQGLEPISSDKEFLRLWLREQGYSGEGEPPKMPPAVAVEAGLRYIDTFERVTGRSFEPGSRPVMPRLKGNLGSL